VRCPTRFSTDSNVNVEMWHGSESGIPSPTWLKLVDLWSSPPTKDGDFCSLITPGYCTLVSEEIRRIGLITPFSNLFKLSVTPTLASDSCGPSDSVCWPSVYLGRLALADEGVNFNPPCCAESSVALRVVVDRPLRLKYGPLRLEWSSGPCENSRVCMALLPKVSSLAAANAKLVVKVLLLLGSELVYPVYLHGNKRHVAEVAVRWEVVSPRSSRSSAVSAHGLKVVFIVERLNVVELYSGK
jgi:hypothetical protein